MHSCWIFNERMISILRPVIEYTEISEIPNYIPPISFYHGQIVNRMRL
jgi:hypothetical protein